MRKNVFGRQFKRDANERKALFKNLISELVLHDRIKTTEQKARAIRSSAEKMVTIARKGGLHARTLLQPHMNAEAVNRMLSEVAPRFVDRPGGYTRMLKLGRRFNDNASMVYIEWVERPVAVTRVPKRADAPDAAEENAPVETAAEATVPVEEKKATKKAAPKKKAATTAAKPKKKAEEKK